MTYPLRLALAPPSLRRPSPAAMHYHLDRWATQPSSRMKNSQLVGGSNMTWD